MSARVILAAIEGPLKGTQFRFDEKRLCLLGRSDNCTIILQDPAVSRNHCMLDIQPPFASVKDLGSTNGTRLNGKEIGVVNPENNTSAQEPAVYSLSHEDKISISEHLFKIMLFPAVFCHICGTEIPEELEEEACQGKNRFICVDCLLHTMQQQKQKSNHDSAASPVNGKYRQTQRIRYCRQCGEIIFPSQEEHFPDDTANDSNAVSCCKRCQLFHNDPSHTMPLDFPLESSSNLLSLPGYRVIKKIGQGGMGTVYSGRCIQTGELVAIKLLRPDLAISGISREQFQKEAERLRTFRHPHIIKLHDSVIAGGLFYFIMDYCDGGTLEEYMRQRQKPLSIENAVSLILQILSALDYTHHLSFQEQSFPDGDLVTVHGAVHRDIKPDNIYLHSENGKLQVRISDFGLSKAYELAGMTGITDTGDFAGSLSFLSRQQFLNYRYAKPEVDIWAAAAVLYYMLTLHTPRDFHHGMNIHQCFQRKPIPIRQYRPDLPSAFSEFMDTALDDSREIRWKSAAGLKTALQQALEESSIQI